MRKLEIKDAEMMKMAIQDEIQRSEESRYDHRLHGLLLVCSGEDCYETSRLLGHSPRTIEGWVHRFESRGFAGLREEERTGRPAAVNEAIMESLNKDLRQDPRSLGYQQNLWDGKLLSHHLETAYGVMLKVRQCQRLFRKMGFRRRKPRPMIANADPQAQGALKKTPPDGKAR